AGRWSRSPCRPGSCWLGTTRQAGRRGEQLPCIPIASTYTEMLSGARCSREQTRRLSRQVPVRRQSDSQLLVLAVQRQCVFVDPVSDIAVLTEPDNQELAEQWKPSMIW